MSKSTYTDSSHAVLIVDPTEQEVTQLRNDMPGWLWVEAPENWPFDLEAKPADRSFDAILVFAHRSQEDRSIRVCKCICEKKSMENVPLLLAASRYQMALGHEVRRLPRGEFIFTPIDENGLLDKTKETKSVSS